MLWWFQKCRGLLISKKINEIIFLNIVNLTIAGGLSCLRATTCRRLRGGSCGGEWAEMAYWQRISSVHWAQHRRTAPERTQTTTVDQVEKQHVFAALQRVIPVVSSIIHRVKWRHKTYGHAGASTPYKRWSKCTMKKIGGKVFART